MNNGGFVRALYLKSELIKFISHEILCIAAHYPCIKGFPIMQQQLRDQKFIFGSRLFSKQAQLERPKGQHQIHVTVSSECKVSCGRS